MKKLLRIVILCAAVLTLAACSASTSTLGNEKHGFVTVSGNGWKTIFELTDKPEEDLGGLMYLDTKAFRVVEVALFDEEDVSEYLSLEDVIYNITEFYWDFDDETNDSEPGKVTFAGYDAISLTNRFFDPDANEDITSQVWAFADENNLYRSVYIEAPNDQFEQLAKEVSETFTLNKP